MLKFYKFFLISHSLIESFLFLLLLKLYLIIIFIMAIIFIMVIIFIITIIRALKVYLI